MEPRYAWGADLSLMDVPARFEADDPRLLDAALAPYAAWRTAEGVEAPRLRVRLRLGGGGRGGGEPSIEVRGPRLRLRAPSARGEADAALGAARCAVSPALAEEPDRLAAEALDTLVLFLLSRLGRVPVHASGVLIGETAVVLAGASGSGKSTLALAGAREGLRVLSDDAVRVQLRPGFRVWGFPRPIHLLPVAGDPDGAAPLRLRSGRWKLAVTPQACRWTSPPRADRAALCLLERGREAALSPLPLPEAVERMTASLEPGFDHFRREMPAVVEALAAGGAWRLALSPNPAEAIALLRARLGQARSRGD